MDQNRAPLFEAVKSHKVERVVAFDVPGHKGGRGNPELAEFLGENCLRVDYNSRKPLDNLIHPSSVIKEAQKLCAEAFSASEAFFMVNGTSSAVQTMIMSTCKAGDKIIIPRNVHRSAINALVVIGAKPIYINPGISTKLGIPLGMAVADVKKALDEHPDAKAVFVNNPTYYGICSNLKEIVRLAKDKGVKVLVDEAHGTHFYFGDDMPVSAMAVGADMAAVSMHKTGGSLTQSSLLLCGPDVDADYVRQVLNLTQTTSGSYLLMMSLDVARRNLALRGREMIAKTVEYADYARKEIDQIGGYYTFSSDLVNGDTVYAYDNTKLTVHTRNIGLAGIEVLNILRDEYGIQLEFGDMGNILAIISAGDRYQDIERLISALSEIKRVYAKESEEVFDYDYMVPDVRITPQEAFYAKKVTLPIEESVGRICSEFIMTYPPGIPILAPGELITREILEYIAYAKEKGALLTGTQDMTVETINVVEGL